MLTSNALSKHMKCQCVWPLQPYQSLESFLVPKHTWQQLSTDLFHFDGYEWLTLVDFYSKMPLVHCIPIVHCKSAIVITLLKEISELGSSRMLKMNSGQQFVSVLFSEFTVAWKFSHVMSLPNNLHSKGFTKVAIKTIKRLVTRAKYSEQDPQFALLTYHSMPFNGKLPSPEEMYRGLLYTMLPHHACCFDSITSILWSTRKMSSMHMMHEMLPRRHHSLLTRLSLCGMVLKAYGCLCLSWSSTSTGATTCRIVGSGVFLHAHDHIWECHIDGSDVM